MSSNENRSEGGAASATGLADPKRPFGFVSLVALVVASMIGTGVFTTSGFAMGDLKDSRLVLAVWCIGGLIALCGSIGYGALAARLPGSGGEYLYLSRSIHPAIGFLAGWISLIAGFTVPMAVSAKAFATYFLSGWSIGEDRIVYVAAAAIVLAAVANMVSTSAGAWLQNSLVIIKLVLLTIFVVIAFSVPSGRWYANEVPTTQWPATQWQLILAMAGSLVWVSLSYTGFNAAIYVAGEVQRAERWVPRSMLVATIVVTVLYLLLNYIFVHGAAAEKIAFKPEVALIAAQELHGNGLASLVRVVVCLATLTSVWSIAITGPRVYVQMTQDGVMPNWLVGRGPTPRLAILAQAILAMIVVYFASLEKMLGYLGLTLSLCAAVTVACVWLPAKQGEPPTSWLARIAATIYVIASLALIVLASFSRVYEAVAAGCTIVFGLLFLAVWHFVAKVQRQ